LVDKELCSYFYYLSYFLDFPYFEECFLMNSSLNLIVSGTIKTFIFNEPGSFFI